LKDYNDINGNTFDIRAQGVSDYAFEKESFAVQGLHPNTASKPKKQNI